MTSPPVTIDTQIRVVRLWLHDEACRAQGSGGACTDPDTREAHARRTQQKAAHAFVDAYRIGKGPIVDLVHHAVCRTPNQCPGESEHTTPVEARIVIPLLQELDHHPDLSTPTVREMRRRLRARCVMPGVKLTIRALANERFELTLPPETLGWGRDAEDVARVAYGRPAHVERLRLPRRNARWARLVIAPGDPPGPVTAP